jgi:hypothetical protein
VDDAIITPTPDVNDVFNKFHDTVNIPDVGTVNSKPNVLDVELNVTPSDPYATSVVLDQIFAEGSDVNG